MGYSSMQYVLENCEPYGRTNSICDVGAERAFYGVQGSALTIHNYFRPLRQAQHTLLQKGSALRGDGRNLQFETFPYSVAKSSLGPLTTAGRGLR